MVSVLLISLALPTLVGLLLLAHFYAWPDTVAAPARAISSEVSSAFYRWAVTSAVAAPVRHQFIVSWR
jgi:hypothetical protein